MAAQDAGRKLPVRPKINKNKQPNTPVYSRSPGGRRAQPLWICQLLPTKVARDGLALDHVTGHTEFAGEDAKIGSGNRPECGL